MQFGNTQSVQELDDAACESHQDCHMYMLPLQAVHCACSDSLQAEHQCRCAHSCNWRAKWRCDGLTSPPPTSKETVVSRGRGGCCSGCGFGSCASHTHCDCHRVEHAVLSSCTISDNQYLLANPTGTHLAGGGVALSGPHIQLHGLQSLHDSSGTLHESLVSCTACSFLLDRPINQRLQMQAFAIS